MTSRNSAFGRPKNYPHIQDKGMFIPDMEADHDMLKFLKEDASPGLRTWYDQNAVNLIPPGRSFYHREPAQFNDPRVLYLVLDTVVKSMEKQYIRPNYVAQYLGQRFSQYYWSSVAVGRVLAGIHAACVETYGIGETPEDDPYVEEDKWMPFAQGRDGVSRYYVIDPHGGNEGRLWLMACRRRMFELAEYQQRSEGGGRRDEYYGKGNAAAVTYNDALTSDGWLVGLGPIRTKHAFDAHLADLSGDEGLPELPDVTPEFSNTPSDGSGVRIGG